MGGKRSHAETEDVHESRQSQVPDSSVKPSKKPRRDGPPKIRKQAHASSVNAVKKRMRDVSRLLQRPEGLPADVRIENERALAAYQQELAAADQEKVRQKMIKKYHMVRFFERQKATRMLKKLKKRLLEANEDEVEDIKAQMHIAEIDLNYAYYYPLNERYVSLYPERGEGERRVEAKDPAERPPLWAEIERRTEEGTLNELRYGVREGHVPKLKPQNQKEKAAPAKRTPAAVEERPAAKAAEKPVRAEPAPAQSDRPMNRRERRKLMLKSGSIMKPAKAATRPIVQEPARGGAGDDDGNISDGGFFEE